MEDLLLKRYGNIDYVLAKDYIQAIKLIERAKEEEQKENYYRLWLVRYPNYDEDNFEQFDDFYEEYKPQAIIEDKRSKDDIMKDVLNITPRKEGE